MKKLALLMAIMMVALMAAAFPASAEAIPVLKGTPEIDGVLDDIYLQSASYTVDTTNDQVYKTGAEYTDAPEFKATTYILYDDQFIYLCTVVTDKTLLSCGKDKIASNGSYTWQNDVVEMWSSLDGGTTWSQFNYDAFGLQLGLSSSYDNFTDSSKLQGAATKGTDSYIVEGRMPHNLKDGAVFDYNVQVNNILVADASKIVCIGAQRKVLHEFKMSGEDVVYEVIEEETEAPAAEKPAEAPKAAAAKTADVMTIALIALAISGSGVIVSKKRK